MENDRVKNFKVWASTRRFLWLLWFFLQVLLDEFGFAFFEFLLASYATEMVGFAFIRNFILSSVFI